MAISVEWRKVEDIVVIDVAGKKTSMIDGTILQQTAQWLLREGHRKLVLNLAKLEDIDSSGVGQLIAAFTTVHTQGGQLRLANPRPEIRRVLRQTRVDTVLPVHNSEEEAVREFT
jgi:anti-sigma B factor antagonist